jgi:hypothetical protein
MKIEVDAAWLRPVALVRRGGRTSHLRALEDLAEGDGSEFILDEGAVRIVPRPVAVEFWREWWRAKK